MGRNVHGDTRRLHIYKAIPTLQPCSLETPAVGAGHVLLWVDELSSHCLIARGIAGESGGLGETDFLMGESLQPGYSGGSAGVKEREGEKITRCSEARGSLTWQLTAQSIPRPAAQQARDESG